MCINKFVLQIMCNNKKGSVSQSVEQMVWVVVSALSDVIHNTFVDGLDSYLTQLSV